MEQTEQIPQNLLAEYFRILRFKGVTNAIFRTPPELHAFLETTIQRPGDGVIHKLMYERVLDSNLLQKLLNASWKRLLRTGRVQRISQVCPCFVGLFTKGEFDARCVVTSSGNLILVNAGALSITLDLLWSAILSITSDVAENASETDDMSADEYVRMVLSLPRQNCDPFDLFENYLQSKHLPHIPKWRDAWSIVLRHETGFAMTSHWLNYAFFVAAQPCVDFFVAHECGHLLAGHAMLQEDAARNIVEECEADRIALELLTEISPSEIPLPGDKESKLSPLFPPQMALFNLTLARLLQCWDAGASPNAAAVDRMFCKRQSHARKYLRRFSSLSLGKIPADTMEWLSAAADAYSDYVGRSS